jgi:hypothetical protein
MAAPVHAGERVRTHKLIPERKPARIPRTDALMTSVTFAAEL